MSKVVMDHIVYLDSKSNELENLLNNSGKILRTSSKKEFPYGGVNAGDILYFVNNSASNIVKAAGIVKSVYNSEKLSKEESKKVIQKHKERLKLSPEQLKKYSGKSYIILIDVERVRKVREFKIVKDELPDVSDGWIPVGDINRVKEKELIN